MIIHKLPQHLINKLKAGEIVERPASVIKELIENSLDAFCDEIIVNINQGGKTLIKVEDNGTGIEVDDLNLAIERYATSKILSEDDIFNISTYGFRGEALASIAEISKFKIQTKTSNSNVGYELTKIQNEIYINQIPFPKKSGTIVYIEDLFFNVPARQKFLKSHQTEWSYILPLLIDFAIVNFNKRFVIERENKNYMILDKKDNLLDRIFDIYKKEWQKNIKYIENGDKNLSIYGIVSDPTLTFPSQDNIKIFVNKRPVQDKIIKKAILQVYERQITPGTYPFSVIFIQLNPNLVDVNVHPRKSEIKFLDPNSIFNFVLNSIKKVFEGEKISSSNFGFQYDYPKKTNYFSQPKQLQLEMFSNISSNETKSYEVNIKNLNFKILGQIWDSYIVLEDNEQLYFVDQHAIAERISFEKMKKQLESDGLIPEIILHPITISYSKNIDINAKINQLNNLGFDISEFSENKLVVYAVPKAFIDNQIEIDILINKLIYLDQINFNIIFDEIFATKACKTSIKAGQKLSFIEMQQLIKDGFEFIDGMFVCQHGRPSFIKIEKQNIEKLFNR